VRRPGAAVRLVNLRKTYGHVVALDSLTLDITAGEFVTLLGPSGSGKTTTLMCVAGFEEPSAGEVLIEGESMRRRPPHRRNIGVVFQSYALFPHLTVAENVAYPLRMRRRPRDEIRRRVDAALDLVRLAGYGARHPRQLSGGQQQRVALARALVFEPPLLLMDEPLGALDKRLREELQLEIKRVHREVGVTVISVTHDQSEALTMSDRIAVMSAGRLEQYATAEELYERPTTRFVAQFIGEATLLPGHVQGETGRHVHVRLEDGPSEVTAVRPAAARAGDGVTIVLRPEKLRLAAGGATEGATGLNVFPGTVADTLYLGDTTKHWVRLDGGQLVVVRSPSRSGAIRAPVGSAVHVTIDPRDVIVVEGKEAAHAHDPS